MFESEIRLTLSKIKMINKKFISYYYSQTLGSDNGLSGFGQINGQYIINIKDAIGGYVNDVKSKRILKAIGFEHRGGDTYFIPVSGLDLIKEGTKIKSVIGEDVIIGKDIINLDSRNGMLSYYIELPNVGR